MVSSDKVLLTIREIGYHARECQSFESFGQEVVNILGNRVGFDYGAILTLDPGGSLSPVALERPDEKPHSLEEDMNYVRSRMSKNPLGLTAWVAKHGRSALVDDVRADSRYYSMRTDIRSELCVPIRVAGQTLGVVNTESTEAKVYTRQDQILLESVALEVAAVMQTFRVRSQLATRAIISLCATCKKYRDSEDVWHPVEDLLEKSGMSSSHGVCPECRPSWEAEESE